MERESGGVVVEKKKSDLGLGIVVFIFFFKPVWFGLVQSV